MKRTLQEPAAPRTKNGDWVWELDGTQSRHCCSPFPSGPVSPFWAIWIHSELCSRAHGVLLMSCLEGRGLSPLLTSVLQHQLA